MEGKVWREKVWRENVLEGKVWRGNSVGRSHYSALPFISLRKFWREKSGGKSFGGKKFGGRGVWREKVWRIFWRFLRFNISTFRVPEVVGDMETGRGDDFLRDARRGGTHRQYHFGTARSQLMLRT